MSPLVARSPHTLVLFFLLLCFVVATLFLNSIGPKATGASPVAPSTPTCPPSGCVYDRVYGYQPRRYDMRSTFNDAASNALGNNGPSYDKINRGLPPNMTQETVSASRPIPHIILRGMAWQESRWLQFANSVSDPDDTYACTLIGYDPGGTCGYGLMQITSMWLQNGGLKPPNQCMHPTGFTSPRSFRGG